MPVSCAEELRRLGKLLRCSRIVRCASIGEAGNANRWRSGRELAGLMLPSPLTLC
jgi:hypothetical protein